MVKQSGQRSDRALTRSRGPALRFALWCAVIALALCVSGRSASAQSPAELTGALASRDSAVAVRPGDVIKLTIWREPDLSGEFPVDEWGVAVLPRLGPMRVTDHTAESLRSALVRAYGEFLNHTSINATVLQRVQVIGAVRNPGLYQVDHTMSISDVVAMAGGATSQGNIRRLELMRDGRRVAGRLSPMTRVGTVAIRSGDQLYVPERSWISRNPGIIIASFSAALSLLLSQLR